jgi:MoaA/NifB/PqqE/SkfB family radical SAM enzyme
VVAAQPFNINISLDAPRAEIHDYLRGYPGLFDKLSQGIVYLLEERKRQQASFPITIKPTVNALNFRYLPELVEWAAKMGDLCVSPQPMSRWTQETYDELWIEEEDMPEFEAVIEQLVTMQKNGSPILTPENVLRLMPDHFRDRPRALPCPAALECATSSFAPMATLKSAFTASRSSATSRSSRQRKFGTARWPARFARVPSSAESFASSPVSAKKLLAIR